MPGNIGNNSNWHYMMKQMSDAELGMQIQLMERDIRKAKDAGKNRPRIQERLPQFIEERSQRALGYNAYKMMKGQTTVELANWIEIMRKEQAAPQTLAKLKAYEHELSLRAPVVKQELESVSFMPGGVV